MAFGAKSANFAYTTFIQCLAFHEALFASNGRANTTILNTILNTEINKIVEDRNADARRLNVNDSSGIGTRNLMSFRTVTRSL